MFKKLKMKKSEQKQCLKMMRDFVEGRMTTEDFWCVYKENDCIKNLLIDDKTRKLGASVFDEQTGQFLFFQKQPWDFEHAFSPERLIDDIDIEKLDHRFYLFDVVRLFFWRRKEKLNFFNADAELYNYLHEILPEWLDIKDTDYLANIMNSAPQDFSETQKLNWCKARIKELFTYASVPPEWNQPPEWPIFNGKPLLFRNQVKDGSRFLYFFYDPETEKETVIDNLINSHIKNLIYHGIKCGRSGGRVTIFPL